MYKADGKSGVMAQKESGLVEEEKVEEVAAVVVVGGLLVPMRLGDVLSINILFPSEIH